MLQSAIIGKQQQAFTIVIKTPDGINIFQLNVVAQGRSGARELRDHAIWLIEKDVAKGQALSA
jgi:hypothetical protein